MCMTIGEKLQYYRKKSGLSQEELGQKLLVSRQTVSLWENGQTMPTIDNLIRLKDIFGVTVDEILSEEAPAEEETEAAVPESYAFTFSEDEISYISKSSLKKQRKITIGFCIAVIAIFFISIVNGSKGAFITVGLTAISVIALLLFFAYRTNKKAFKKSNKQVIKNTYHYEVGEKGIRVRVVRDGECKFFFDIDYTDVKSVTEYGDFIVIVYDNRSYILRKTELRQDSPLWQFLQTHPSKKKQKPPMDKWQKLSLTLFVLSILTIWFSLFAVAIATGINGMFESNMWLFFLFIPIPVASIIVGFYLKPKGYKVLKNIVAGFIMTGVLCLYGSFCFMFDGFYSHDDTGIKKIESLAGIDIPDYRQVNTHDWSKGEQSLGTEREYVCYVSSVLFDQIKVEDFEKQLENNKKWIDSVPSKLVGVMSTLSAYDHYDYVMVYNVDTGEFNTAPKESGTYRFINVSYSVSQNEMQIVEYDIQYVE